MTKFYKYMSTSTALKVLSNQTLRWSAPTKFNDPFDVPREIASDISPSEIKTELGELLVNFIKNTDLDISHLTEKNQNTINLIRSSPPVTRDKIQSRLIDESNSIFNLSVGLERFQEMWRKLLPEFRILCLSEEKDVTSMWYHYANKYKGVVVELICKDELDSPWLVARPVDYPTKTPHIFTAGGWAEMIMMQPEESSKKILDAYTYTKTPDWGYEKEWRITSFKSPHEKGEISDYETHPSHFSKIYFGPLIEKIARQEILSVARNKLPHIQSYDVELGLSRKFIFKPIENS